MVGPAFDSERRACLLHDLGLHQEVVEGHATGLHPCLHLLSLLLGQPGVVTATAGHHALKGLAEVRQLHANRGPCRTRSGRGCPRHRLEGDDRHERQEHVH
jgi:hypothetical protein